jgi:hypothetical protein
MLLLLPASAKPPIVPALTASSSSSSSRLDTAKTHGTALCYALQHVLLHRRQSCCGWRTCLRVMVVEIIFTSSRMVGVVCIQQM